MREKVDGPRRKKRSSAALSNDSDENKKRGRPRVERQDDSAVDVCYSGTE